jgi:hypothetical protein
MRFTLNLSFLEPENYVPAARMAEAAGTGFPSSCTRPWTSGPA